MQTLIINGSPRKNGGTATLISELKKQLIGHVTIINTYYANISPCIDCRHCWTHSKCAIDDEMQNVYQLIDNADNIVLASPIYFGELTGSLLQWASRLQYIWVSKNFRNEFVLKEKSRYGGVILVDGGDGYKETAFAMSKRLLKMMGAQYKDLVYFSGTDKIEPTLPCKDTVEEIHRLSRILNRI